MRTFLLALLIAPLASLAAAEVRCGWLDNPTPGNYWLTDADGEWTLSVQGMGDRGNGFLDAPWGPEPPNSWVATNGSYGYGCACFDGQVDWKSRWATAVWSVRPLTLDRCLADPALPNR